MTPGFASLIKDSSWNESKTELRFTADITKEDTSVLVCMKEGYEYCFTANGMPVEIKKMTSGAYAVKLPKGDSVEVKIYKV